MFTVNNNGNNDPFVSNNSDQSILQKPLINEKQEDPPLSFFHFPSPFVPYELQLDQDNDVYLLQEQHDLLVYQQSPLDHSIASQSIVINMADSMKIDMNNGLSTDGCKKKNYNTTDQQILRKRSSKRDRHSKINTAQGLRDRRMRLSLDVAREFFWLQDMLGYDKASKTVEWLLIQAKPEIKKLEKGRPQMNYSSSVGAKSASSTSECEVVSGGFDVGSRKSSISKGSKHSTKEKKTRQLRKAAGHNPLAKDLRQKARARARERTIGKMWSRKFDESKKAVEARNQEISQLGSCSPFEAGEESGTQSQNMNPSMEIAVTEVEEPISSHERQRSEIQEEMIDEPLLIMKWSPSTFLNYLHNPAILQEHQFTDCQVNGKLWEAYNYQNLC